jgi:hypothetical protein
MKPTYRIRVWQQGDWWMARVIAASEDAGQAPLNAITRARGLARIEVMARDLIATVLDAEEDTFDVDVEYVLPGEAGDLVRQAKGARAWLEAAQALWQDRSVLAARSLADQGYSLRETATLLGLSYQRVDQLLGTQPGHEFPETRVIWFGDIFGDAADTDTGVPRRTVSPAHYNALADFVAMVANRDSSWLISRNESGDSELENRFRAFVHEVTAQLSRQRPHRPA